MRKKLLLFSAVLVLIIVQCVHAQKGYENRNDIPKEYKWNLNDIYPNWDEWSKGLKQMESKMDEIVGYKGKIKTNPENFLKVLTLQDELGILAEKVYRYPQFAFDLNANDQNADAKLQQVRNAYIKFGTATSWINPEILEIPWSKMEKWLNGNSEFGPYKFGITDLFRQQKHVLDADKEKLLSYYSQLGGNPGSTYKSLAVADIDFPMVELSTGEKVKATNGNYYRVLSLNKNQEDRRKMFEQHYGTYKKNKNSFASIYAGICERDWANAQARGYSSCLEANLDANNIPVAVYENLINTVKSNTAPLQRYNQLRKKILKLDKYHPYDNSIMLTDFSKTYPYEEAKEWALASVEPMGKEYVSNYKNAIESGWVDVYETPGKAPGAYSGGLFGVHPFMLMNYNETLDNVFTLAHEMGHTMHTLLSEKNQPYTTSVPTLFVAEVASTFNEALLLDYLLSKSTDHNERISLITQAIKNIAGTFYLQVLFADYELQAHRLIEQGKPFTEGELTRIMNELNTAYYGTTNEPDEFIDYCWARIPHFYTVSFYVYQYATCFVSSAQLFNEYKETPGKDKQGVIDRVQTLLKAGGNDHPMEQLKKAGVDLTKPQAVKAVIDRMDYLVTLLENEVNTIK